MIQTKHPITKPTTDTIHILGNGPSLDLFNRDDWPDEHEFVGCNFSDIKYRPDYTVIMDAKPIMQFCGGYKLKIPAVISDRCVNYIEKDLRGWEKLPADAFVLVDIVPMIHDKAMFKFPMNSGHHATLYAIERNKDTASKVYLWGFDSLWSNDISSKTDEIVHRTPGPRVRPTVADTWRQYWDRIFDSHSHIIFKLVGEENEKLR